MIYDVIVIGMGPAGSMAAYEAATRNLSVLALDKARFPRYKTCGGGLSTKIHQLVDLDNLSCIENAITSLRLSRGSTKKTFHFDEPIAYMVMRERFDQELVERAIKRGVEFKDGITVQNLDEQNEYTEIHSDGGAFKGRLVIGADGALGLTTKWLNPGIRIRNAPGIEGEFQKNHDLIESSSIEIEVGEVKSGYGWIFPKKEVLSVGAASFLKSNQIKTSYHRYTEAVYGHSDLPSCIKTTGHPLPIYTDSRLKLTSRRLLLAGDAGHLVDPFFGEGIYYAMRSGQIAGSVAESFIRNGIPLSQYSKIIEREFYPEFKSAKRLAWLIYTYPKFWFDLILRHPGVVQLYAEVLSGKRSYRSFLPTILKTAVKKCFD